jgi:hypothetical protein
MGAGFFPVTLGWLLVALGLIVLLLAFRNTVQVLTPPPFALRAIVAVPCAILVFSLVVDRFGLVPATFALTLVAVLAEKPFKLRRTLMLAASLSLISWLIFIVGLNMTLAAFIF